MAADRAQRYTPAGIRIGRCPNDNLMQAEIMTSRSHSRFSRFSPLLACALALGLAACKSSNGASQGAENTAAPAPAAAPVPAAEPAPAVEPAPAAEAAPAAPTPVAAAEAPVYSGPEPCKGALKGDSPVAKACRAGGTKEAKKTMKAMVKQGRAAGLDFECDSCHKDGGGMVDGTKERFEKLVAAYKP